MKLNEWELKQLVDVVSKGLNSILMREGETETTDLRLQRLANTLESIYRRIIETNNKQGDECVKPKVPF